MSTHLIPPRRTAPFNDEPGFYEPAGLWLYGNVRLLDGKLMHISEVLGDPSANTANYEEIERETEHFVLKGHVIVTGIHNPGHQRVAVVPLRWGAPRVLVFSGGFCHHLGEKLEDEPFRTARLWRYKFDARTDLVISKRAPERKPTYARFNPTVDRLIVQIATRRTPGLLFEKPAAQDLPGS